VRHLRVRKRVLGTHECPRLTVFRSNKHVYAQLVDDLTGKTIVSASSFDVPKRKSAPPAAGQTKKKRVSDTKSAGKELKTEAKVEDPARGTKSAEKTRKVAIAYEVGALVGEKAKKNKIEKAIFDRSGYKFHGRTAAVAEGARSKGLKL